MRNRANIMKLLDIMAALRTPETGCPWDIEQTFQSISHYTIEEAYEVVDAIDRNDLHDLKDELGDLLLQVVFHSRMAEEAGHFEFSDVVDAISDKMIRRHPYVFGTEEERAAGPQAGMWDRIKAEEKALKPTHEGEPESLLDDVPVGFPAMTRAAKLQKKTAKVGFDWPDIKPVFAKIREELDELEAEIDASSEGAAIEEEYGDLLFVLANLGRHLQIDPETAVRKANNKFARRFAGIEAKLAEQGKSPKDSNLKEMDALWDQVKLDEKKQQSSE